VTAAWNGAQSISTLRGLFGVVGVGRQGLGRPEPPVAGVELAPHHSRDLLLVFAHHGLGRREGRAIPVLDLVVRQICREVEEETLLAVAIKEFGSSVVSA
jgi:hypothetical protein